MSTTVVIPEVHPAVRSWLSSDSSVRSHTRDRVFAGSSYPAETELPAVRFRFESISPMSAPAPVWWAFTGNVYCHADKESDADSLAVAVLDALLRLGGATHEDVVFQGIFDWGVLSVEDGEWTPPRPQRIVTVTLTARAA